MEDMEKAEELYDKAMDLYYDKKYFEAINLFKKAESYADWSLTKKCRFYAESAKRDMELEENKRAQDLIREVEMFLIRSNPIAARIKLEEALEICFDPNLKRECRELLAEIEYGCEP